MFCFNEHARALYFFNNSDVILSGVGTSLLSDARNKSVMSLPSGNIHNRKASWLSQSFFKRNFHALLDFHTEADGWSACNGTALNILKDRNGWMDGWMDGFYITLAQI